MPRGPRLDAPGVLHHVMTRGLERRAIFRDARDRADFGARLAGLGETRRGGALLPARELAPAPIARVVVE